MTARCEKGGRGEGREREWFVSRLGAQHELCPAVRMRVCHPLLSFPVPALHPFSTENFFLHQQYLQDGRGADVQRPQQLPRGCRGINRTFPPPSHLTLPACRMVVAQMFSALNSCHGGVGVSLDTNP